MFVMGRCAALCCAVLADVGRAMFAEKFIEELFKPQEMYAPLNVRQVFDKLAHSSIMRLNENSMDKVSAHSACMIVQPCHVRGLRAVV